MQPASRHDIGQRRETGSWGIHQDSWLIVEFPINPMLTKTILTTDKYGCAEDVLSRVVYGTNFYGVFVSKPLKEHRQGSDTNFNLF